MPIGINSDEYNKPLDVSIVSASMNRHTSIIASLHNWIFLPVKEIVIIDWCSFTKLIDIIPTYLSEREEFKKVRIYRVDGFDKWVLTWAFNLGLHLARSTYILKVDAEIRISDRFFITNPNVENTFYRGYWDKSPNKYLNGQFYCKKSHLEAIGFFNENIVTYGYDDTDLYKRLSDIGLKEKIIEGLIHVDHTDTMRVHNNNIPAVNFEITYNKILSEKYEPVRFNIDRYRKKNKDNYVINHTILKRDESIYKNVIKGRTEVIESMFKEERFVVLKVFNGIGNRLRALFSTLEFCKLFSYRLYVIWENTKGYDSSTFEEHFSLLKDVTFVTGKQYDDANIRFDINIMGMQLEISEEVVSPPIFDKVKHKKIFIESANYITNMYKIGVNTTCDYFGLLRPSENVRYIIDYIKTNILIGNYNIFHIRRGDATNGIYKKNYVVSSIYLFAKYIIKSDKINVVLSDDYDYCRKFLDVLCPNKYIIINEKSLNKFKTPDENKYGVNMDVVDFFLFRDACNIYATNWSSFSYVAAHVFKKFGNYFVLEDSNRFALFKYDKSRNIGNYAQSQAVENYLPYVSEYIERHDVGNYSGNNCNLVIAGLDISTKENHMYWPSSSKITPLLISFNASDNSVASESHLSLCITLTLKYTNICKVPNQVLCVDVPKSAIGEDLKTRYNCIHISSNFDETQMKSSTKDKFDICDKYIRLIASSILVVTSQLHVLSICLANQISVRFVDNDTSDLTEIDRARYNSMKDLIGNPDLVKKTLREMEFSIISKIYEKFYKYKIKD